MNSDSARDEVEKVRTLLLSEVAMINFIVVRVTVLPLTETV